MTLKFTRIAFIFLLIFAMAAGFIYVLYDITVVDAESYVIQSAGSVATVETISSARGAILDRNGTLLASDRTVYSVTLSRSRLLEEDLDARNDIVLRLVRAALDNGVEYNDSFPVTMSAPFQYTALRTERQESRLQKFLERYHVDPDISAPELMSWMRDHYDISFTTSSEDARRIIGVRYELELRIVINTTDYVFASDVPVDFVTNIKEQRLSPVSVTAATKREYHTDYARHVLGSVGYISKEYLEAHPDVGYTLNSIVGKSGAESAFEEYLRGVDGKVRTYRDKNGNVTDIEVISEPKAGSNVYLTIDSSLQKSTEDALSTGIAQLNADRDAEELEKAIEENREPRTLEHAEGGAAVVIKVGTGEVLSMASYPDYDVSMWNRAVQGTYEPGSTFKMVTALAGLNMHKITPETRIYDEGEFTEYKEYFYTPRCWVYPGSHGNLDVVGALENSCNYFFYQVADDTGITAIANTAKEFGFGQESGIELDENIGVVASRESKREILNDGWYDADTLQAGIGQSINQFSPLQIANYCATIATGGTRYSATILDYVTTADYSATLVDRQPEIVHVIDDSEGYFPVIQKGMEAVAKTGTARSAFRGFPISVACKTGTVQSDNTSVNNAVFVCYAPADAPEIAIAVVVEKGGSGSSLTAIAKDILTAYFSTVSERETVPYENTPVR